MTKGLASFNIPEMSQMIFAVVDPQEQLNLRGMKMNVFQYFGMEDSVLNHINLLMSVEKGSKFQHSSKGESILDKRQYQVSCIKASECLKLDMENIDKMKKDFMGVSVAFFRKMIDQFFVIYCYHKHC